MFWTHARVRRPRNLEVQRRFAEVRREHPESESWLALLEAALGEGENGALWERAVPRPAPARPVKAPLLFRADIPLNRGRAGDWVRRLVRRADGRAARRLDAVGLLEAAVSQDYARADALAEQAGANAGALRVVAQMAAIPLLQACARILAAEVPSSWWEGYCPVCGGWPVLAESVGLERRRHLRCGRCGLGWPIPPLRCVFCDEADHGRLGYLAPEDAEPTRTVEVCRSCKGYLKGMTTVRPLAPWAVLLDDLATVHLDVVALERGYQRPERAAYALEARIP